MEKWSRRDALVGMSVVVLAGCGGDSGSNPPPTGGSPTPTPTPTPTPSPLPIGDFATLGQTSALTFASVGYSVRGRYSGWDFIVEEGSYNSDPGQTIRLETPQNVILAIPGFGEDVLVAVPSSELFEGNRRIRVVYEHLEGWIDINVPLVGDRYMQYARGGYWYSAPWEAQAQAFTLLFMAYGVATVSMPTTGRFSYTKSWGEQPMLEVDFGARTVSGTISKYGPSPVPEWSLTDVTISPDGAGFEGKLTAPGAATSQGNIKGIFVGPNAEEFIAQLDYGTAESLTLIYGKR